MNTRSALLVAFFIFMCFACSVFQQRVSGELHEGYYLHREPGEKPKRVYVNVNDDSIEIHSDGKVKQILGKQFFYRYTGDVDVLTTPFKYRPSSYNFPRQMDTDFNGSVYLGVRTDRFRVRHLSTPAGTYREVHHNGISVGGFLGCGSSFISPWTTNYRITDEYSGLVLSRGFAVMTSVNSLTVGLGVGWDALTDRDKDVWIYQNKPWYGVTIGLSLN